MKYTKLSILIRPNSDIPYFVGSQLRGALGYALKKVTCINPSYRCKECFAKSNCLYYSFYEETNSYHKYRFDFELGKDYYDFSFYLFNNITDKLPYIVSAFYTMFTQHGLGKDRATYKEFDMYINDTSCIINKMIQIPQEYIQKLKIDKIYHDVLLRFVTPLRIKKDNRFIRDDNIELKDIINSIYQRQMRLLNNEYKKFPYEIKGKIIQKELEYQELTRLSNRQQTTMRLGGVMGSIKIEGLSKECYEVLKVGELIGVGKSTVFGLGKIKIKDMK